MFIIRNIDDTDGGYNSYKIFPYSHTIQLNIETGGSEDQDQKICGR